MRPYFEGQFFNPASPYTPARTAALAITAAREQLSSFLDADAESVVFTSGGTESNATAIHLARAWHPKRKHWICSATEHASVLESLAALEREGHRISRIPVDRAGRLDVEMLRSLLTDDTALISVMTANNETGVQYPVAEIVKMARARGIPVHADAAQSAGRVPVSFRALGADLMTCCAHKMHGPKGAGALLVRHDVPRVPLLAGGGQENGWRAGTESVPAIVGFGVAAQCAQLEMRATAGRLRKLRDIVEHRVCAAVPDCIVVGAGVDRLPNTTLFLVPGLDTDVLLAQLDLNGACCSSGSACASGSAEPSHVLRAMGWVDGAPKAAVRVSWGRFSTEEEANNLVSILCDGVRDVRARLLP